MTRSDASLRHFADAKGASAKSHETITVAYMLIIAERLAGHSNWSWDQFAAANPDLLARTSSPLALFFGPETLMSERARQRS